MASLGHTMTVVGDQTFDRLERVRLSFYPHLRRLRKGIPRNPPKQRLPIPGNTLRSGLRPPLRVLPGMGGKDGAQPKIK